MLKTMKDAIMVGKKIIWYDGFGAMDTDEDGFKQIVNEKGTFDLEGIRGIVRDLAKIAPFDGTVQDDLENRDGTMADKVSRMCVIVDMCEKVNMLAAEQMQLSFKAM